VKELFAYGKPVTGDDLIDREEIVEEKMTCGFFEGTTLEAIKQ
jgi:hypothetical protein